MKRRYFPLLLLAISFLLSGCATTRQTPQETNGGFSLQDIDFRKYSEEGFLFTTQPPAGEYESRGILRVTLYPIIRRLSRSEYGDHQEGDAITKVVEGEVVDMIIHTMVLTEGDNTHTVYYGVEVLDLQDAVEPMYQSATEFNADAVTEFTVNREERDNNGLIIEVIEVSGFAIKRQ